MSGFAEARGQLLLGRFRQCVPASSVVEIEDECAAIVGVGDSVRAGVLDYAVGELVRAQLLCLPRVAVGDDESALRCDVCQHERRRISIKSPRCPSTWGVQSLDRIPGPGVNRVGDRVLARGTRWPQRQYAGLHA